SLELLTFTLQLRLKNQHYYSKPLGVTSIFYNKSPPEYKSLTALETAKSGGRFRRFIACANSFFCC
ncbi:MAG: hypothetical protein KME35_07470, partial [Aphanocapsa sp. GSE-SYN-MK-11-07L]|nr:hypothetical protein [Aphanocapsa sp. GSE-SYN-MK-11-07L]MBW4550933.1 hypothetical protein [Aphanocapsa sp. GSE-SYN-MK-11-07L]